MINKNDPSKLSYFQAASLMVWLLRFVLVVWFLSSVTRSESRIFPLERLKFPQSFPIFHILPYLCGNFPKICKVYHNIMSFSPQNTQNYYLSISLNIKWSNVHFPYLKYKDGISIRDHPLSTYADFPAFWTPSPTLFAILAKS